GCPGTTANQLACNDDSCGVQSRVAVIAAAGTTYLIRVSGYSGASGPFTLNLSLQDPPPPPTIGPDVTVGNLTDVMYYGAVGSISAYAVGTDACNVGDVPVEWVAGDNHHPVVGQNMYRLMNGRFEQIGQSWLKHTFASTNSSEGICGT